jgi:hypothetical protein
MEELLPSSWCLTGGLEVGGEGSIIFIQQTNVENVFGAGYLRPKGIVSTRLELAESGIVG